MCQCMGRNCTCRQKIYTNEPLCISVPTIYQRIETAKQTLKALQEELRAIIKHERIKANALKKLTKEEKEILGL